MRELTFAFSVLSHCFEAIWKIKCAHSLSLSTSTTHGAKGEWRSFVSENRGERYTVSLYALTATSCWIIKSPRTNGVDENGMDQRASLTMIDTSERK